MPKMAVVGRRATGAQLDAWESILRVQARVVAELDADLQKADLIPLRWYDVLLELDKAPDRRLRMTELAERVVLSRTRVSRVVDELEQAGLVCRQPNRQDRRSRFAALTDQGRRWFRRSAPVYLRGIEEHFGRHISNREAATIRDSLRRILDATH